MWLCEDKLNGKTVHFQFPSKSQKRHLLKAPQCYPFQPSLEKKKRDIYEWIFFLYVDVNYLIVTEIILP